MLDRLRLVLRSRRGRHGRYDVPAADVRGVYFTCLLDASSCPACRAADDDHLRRLDDPTRIQAPHPSCTSPQGCRCMEVFVLRDESEPAGGWNWSPESASLNSRKQLPS